MRVRLWQCAIAMAGLLITSVGATDVRAQSVEELNQRIQELERSTREQVETLKRMIQQPERERAADRQGQEERERAYQVLKEQVERQQVSLQKQEERVAKLFEGWEDFFDLQAGRRQSNNNPNPIGKDIQGNVYTGDAYKVRLGGSLRLHVQRNDTPVGESVTAALLPDTSKPGGGDNGGRENFRAFAGRTRLNLAIQGPETLGGRTQGFLEMDFNQQAAGAGESNAINNNPRLRHAFGRWRFDDLAVKGDELILTLGQTESFADNSADSVDFNTLLGGLGAALRRNPRIELVHKYPLTSNLKFVTSLGFERPFFGNDVLSGSTDLGPGDLSGFPALSGGIGLEAGRIGQTFGIGSTKIYLRTTWGEFEEPAGPAARFTNQTAWGTVTLDRIGVNKTGRAMTLQLRGGGLWTRGEGRITNSEFDRRLIKDTDGSLTEAESVGGFINPIFFLTETLSVRWAGGAQFALDNDRPVFSGPLTSNFFRVNNRQSEVSLWWTPGPFTFALSYNHTVTDWRSIPATRAPLVRGSETRENENNKIEFISWWSF